MLDLMEEFRAPMVDACVLSLINSGNISPEDFEVSQQGCEIKPAGYKALFTALEEKLNSQISHTSSGNVSDYRRIMEFQVRHIKSLIKEDSDAYKGFFIR